MHTILFPLLYNKFYFSPHCHLSPAIGKYLTSLKGKKWRADEAGDILLQNFWLIKTGLSGHTSFFCYIFILAMHFSGLTPNKQTSIISLNAVISLFSTTHTEKEKHTWGSICKVALIHLFNRPMQQLQKESCHITSVVTRLYVDMFLKFTDLKKEEKHIQGLPSVSPTL